MRLGTTSYIYPSDVLTNVGRLAGRVSDVELVLFEVDSRWNNLPDDGTVAELGHLAADHDLTFTVHLPLDLGLAGDRPALEKARTVIRCTAPLLPHGYIVHLDGETTTTTDRVSAWLDNSLHSLDALVTEVGSPKLICVENLDSQPPAMLDAILELSEVSCCVDIGHLWKQGLDARARLESWLSRARVVHLHGVGKRDHKRLSLVPPAHLDPVVEVLTAEFDGVVTLEIFNEPDLVDSLAVFEESVRRVRGHVR